MSRHEAPQLAEVGPRLAAAVAVAAQGPLSPVDLYDLYESAAIQILDSEHQDYPPGVLEAYLLGYLAALPQQH